MLTVSAKKNRDKGKKYFVENKAANNRSFPCSLSNDLKRYADPFRV
jgi:hypothetical protein